MNHKLYNCLLLYTIIMLCGCSSREGKVIEQAYRLSSAHPDSALILLSAMNRHGLSSHNEARYALVFTMAQDKSGLDVDNDSLLSVAYTYYNSRLKDSLYAKCMYYEGKYCMLNGMSEKALECFKKSVTAAKSLRDKYTMCLSLNRMSKIQCDINTSQAVKFAKKADLIDSTIPAASQINKVYFKLDLCQALALDGHLSAAKLENLKAMKVANATNDSMAISSTCQNLSGILRKSHEHFQALQFSKKAYQFASYPNNALLLNLSWAYLNVDSLDECDQFLSKVKTDNPENLYTLYYLRHLSAIKRHNYKRTIQFADSAYYFLETMYGNEITKKEHYYTDWSKSRYEKEIVKSRSKNQFYLLLVVSIATLIVISALLYAHKQPKKKVEAEIRALKNKQEKQQMELRQQEDNMHRKEMQLTAMRRFIINKVDTAQKLETIKKGEKGGSLSEKDWEEITMFVDSIEDSFVTRLQNEFTFLNQREIRFLVLIRARIPAKALARIYGIQEKSIKQKLFVYKSKLNLADGSTSLRKFIENY